MAITTGVPNSYLLPGHFLFVEYGGAFGPSGDQRRILVAGPMTGDGTATINTVYDVQDDNHSDLLSGIGSFTAALCRAIRANYRTASIALVITEDHAAGAAAAGTIAPAGTATSAGILTVKIEGRVYTSSIEIGDTAEIVSEKVNVLLNPTKLEMAIRSANEYKVDFNAHLALAPAVHQAADAVNPMVAANASNLGTLITLVNEARTNYEPHRILVGGGPVHGTADATNALTAAAATDLDSAVVLMKDLKAKYEAHRVMISGAPQVHVAADGTNVLVAEDPVDETHPHLSITSLVNPAGPQVDILAKNLGLMGNEIRVRTATDAGGITFTEPTDNRLASGANEPDYSAAYAVALLTRYHYIAPVTNDQTVLTTATSGLKDRLVANEQAVTQRRMQAEIGHDRAPTTGETLCDSLDYYRMQVTSLESDTPPWEMCGSMSGIRCFYEGLSVSYNLANVRLIGIVPPDDQADYPTDVELDNAMHQGLTLLTVNAAGEVRIPYSITTKHTDGAGHADLSVWGTSKVTVGDDIADTIVTKAALTFQGFKLMPNPSDPSTVIPDNTTTPARFEEFLYEILKGYETDGHLTIDSVDDTKTDIHAEINGSNPNRADYRYPFAVVDHFLTSSGMAQQVG